MRRKRSGPGSPRGRQEFATDQSDKLSAKHSHLRSAPRSGAPVKGAALYVALVADVAALLLALAALVVRYA